MKPVLFIFATLLIDTIGFGIIIPVIPELITELTGEGLSKAAFYGGWLMFVYALTQFIFAPILGNLSDRFGRRPVLLLALFMLGVDYLIMAFATTLAWLFIGRLLVGMAGATYATANAYIADISSEDKKAQNFGMLGAAFGLGFIIGPALGGILGEYGSRVPFYAAATLAFLNMAYGYLILPESLSPDKRRPFAIQRANPFGALKQMRQYPIVLGLIASMVFYQLAHDANPAVWTYFTMLQFDWSKREVGFSLAFVGLMITIVQGGLIRSVIPRLGEARTAYLGLLMGGLGFIGFAFSTAGWMLYAWIVPWSLMSLASPAVRTIMSNHVPANAQGALQGAISSLMSLTAIAAPLLMTGLFRYFTAENAPAHFPGASFFAAGLLLLGSIGITMRAIRTSPSLHR